MNHKIKNFVGNFLLFTIFYAALVIGATAIYVHYNFGIVTIDKFLSVLDEVFYLDWAVRKIKIYTSLLLFVAFLGIRFLKVKYVAICSFLLFLLPILEFDIISYFRYRNITTNFFEENYVEPKIDQTKRNNIIILYLESFEEQFATPEIAPFLANLKKENLSFDGFTQITSTFSTIHAQFASMCGIVLKQENTDIADDYMNFMPNISCMSDLLKKIGYTTAYYKAANTTFSRANFFAKQHSFDVVKGFVEFKEDAAKITKDYEGNVFGGLKDSVLFELAKKEISGLKQPFFATITSLDMHEYPEVYYDPACERKFGNVRDAASCTAKSVENFVNWFKQQPFYKNTTLVILGDHQVYTKFLSASPVLNIFINSAKSTDFTDRKFTTLDFAPTILEAAGYNIEEFGIGRSLFSKKQTLFEKDGNKFSLMVVAKNKLFDKMKKFDNTISSYKPYKLNTVLDNKALQNYTDFGVENEWCNKATQFSMTADNISENGAFLKMKYLRMKEPFIIYANDVKIFENDTSEIVGFREEVFNTHLPKQVFEDGNKLTIKISWPYNNVNVVFGLCIKEFSINDK